MLVVFCKCLMVLMVLILVVRVWMCVRLIMGRMLCNLMLSWLVCLFLLIIISWWNKFRGGGVV